MARRRRGCDELWAAAVEELVGNLDGEQPEEPAAAPRVCPQGWAAPQQGAAPETLVGWFYVRPLACPATPV